MACSRTSAPRARSASTVAGGKRFSSRRLGPLSEPKLGRLMACWAFSPQLSTPYSVLAVKWMISAPPGLPPLITSWPVALSNTSVGAIDERGRLPGCTRLAIGLALRVGGREAEVGQLVVQQEAAGRP